MSKDKLQATEIAGLISENTGQGRRVVEDFLKAFIATLEETLLADEVIKIKGLGTFKLQWNAPRKSVDVNTGSEIVIDGYYKVVFVPEAELKASVNEPYAHLESTVLDGGLVESVDAVDPAAREEDVPEALRVFTEQATEIKNILSEINSLNQQTEEDEVEEDDDEIADEDDVADEVVVEEGPDEAGSEDEISPDEAEIKAVAAVEEEQPEKDNIEPPVVAKNSRPVVGVGNAPDTTYQLKKRKRRYRLDLFFIGIMVGAALVYVMIDLNVFQTIADLLKANGEKTLVQQPAVVEAAEPFVADTVENLSPDTIVTVPVSAEPVDSLQLLFDQPRTYTEFIDTEKVIPGSRLTRIAERHYGVKEFWVYIYEANMDKFDSPDYVKPGTVLKIPKLDPRLADKNNPRCMEYARELHDRYVQ